MSNVQKNILLTEVRLRVAFLAQPYVSKNDNGQDKASYSVVALFEPNSQAHQVAKAGVREVAQAAWGAQYEAVLQQLAAQDRLFLHDGATKATDPSYAGKLFVSASSSRKPRCLVTRNGQNVEISENDPMFPYSGCWANILINPWAQGPDSKPNKFGKRVNAEILAVQFLRHDEAFGRVAAPEKMDEFPMVETAGADAPPPAGGAAASLI
jgi:hypothetical protein